VRSAITKHLVPANQDPLLVLICWAVGITALLEILPAVLLRSFFDAYMGAVLGAYAIGLVLAFRLPRRAGGWDRPRWIAALGLMAVCVALAPLMPRQAGLGIAPLIGFAMLLPALGGRRTRIGTAITLLVVVVTSILQDRPAADVDSLLVSVVRSTGVAMAAQMLLFILWRQRKDIVDALQRYASLYGGVPIGLFRATPEGSFAEANDAFVALLGFRDRAALLATPVAQVFRESGDRGQVFAEFYGRGESIVELVARRADGREIWTRLHVRALCAAARRPRHGGPRGEHRGIRR